MSVRKYLTGAALVIAATTGACAPATQTHGVDEFSGRTTVVVENNNWQDMTLYVLRNGVRARLGSVPALSQARFVLSPTHIAGTGEVRILADPLGSSQKWTSQPINVSPGSEVRFRLENNVQLSSYSVLR